ncbi:MAG: hypothetical protein ACJAT7_003065 [Psychromonas sp.]
MQALGNKGDIMNSKDLIENIDKIEESHTYQSGFKGVIDESGKALTTIGQAVNTVLLPVHGMIWGGDKIKNWLNERIAKKLELVPIGNVISPNPHIAGPAIEALRFTAQEEDLREMFASLLANSINSETSGNVHPAFVDIIKSMNKNDAITLRELASESAIAIIDIGIINSKNSSINYVARNVSLLGKSENSDQLWCSIRSIENIERMGLCTVIKSAALSDENLYIKIEEDEVIKEIIEHHSVNKSFSPRIDKGALEITQFGKMFVHHALLNKLLHSDKIQLSR